MNDNRGKIVYIFLNPVRRSQRYYALDLDNDNIIKQGTFQLKPDEVPRFAKLWYIPGTRNVPKLDTIKLL